MKVTFHRDDTVSIRLPKRTIGSTDADFAVDDLTHALTQAISGFARAAKRDPQHADAYRQLHARYTEAVRQLQAVMDMASSGSDGGGRR